MMTLALEVRGLDAALAKIDGVGPRVHAALTDTVTRETFELQRHVVEDKLSGQVLNARTGTLRRSITTRIEDAGGVIRGIVGTNLTYARAHEYGVTFMHPGSIASRAQALHFTVGGRDVFVKRTRPHPITIPERSFLRSALQDRRPAFEAAVRDTIATVLGS